MRRIRRFLFFALLIAIVAYVIWDRIETAALSRDIAAIAARGEPVHYGDGLPQPRTPQQREASSLYAEAAGLAMEQSIEENRRASRLDLDKPGVPEISLPDAVAAYRADAPALQLLDRATPFDFGGFAAEDRLSGQNQMPLTALGTLACLRADLMAVRGDGDAAARALVPCIGLQRTMSPGYRSQHAQRLLGSIRILLRHTQPSDASLVMLQGAMESWPEEDAALRSVLQDRARIMDMVEGGYVPPTVNFFFHPFMVRSARRSLASFEPIIAIARQPWQARWEGVAELERSYRAMARTRRPGFIGQMLDPVPIGYPGMGLTSSGRDLASRRAGVAVIAVERYRRSHAGALPASLDALVPALVAAVPQDPFFEKPLVYRKDADSYVIYSVDADRRDDAGALYGHGAALTKNVGPQSPRDLGIRVPLKPVR